MGYYTRYYLAAEDRSGAVFKKLGAAFINGLGLARDYADGDDPAWNEVGIRLVGAPSIVALADEEPCKWYDYDEEMKRASLAHPGVLFTLDGAGEEAGDIWRRFYLAGAVSEWRPDIRAPDFDTFVAKKK